MTTFENAKPGDRVYYLFGPPPDEHGHNAVISEDHVPTGVLVVLDNGFRHWFDMTGRLSSLDDMPSLFWGKPRFAPEQPKRTVKKPLSAWVNIYPFGFSHHVCASRSAADACASPGRIACVELKGEYEVEE